MSTGNPVERRRELNRIAAQKLRNRQKEKAVNVKQDYFAAQSRNTQLIYDVKQLRKQKLELERQFDDHIPICQHGTAKNRATPQTAGIPVVQNGGFLQYPSSQQPYLSPVLLLSTDGNVVVPTTAVQLMTITPSDASFSNSPESNLTDTSINTKQESDHCASDSRLTNGDSSGNDSSSNAVQNGMLKAVSAASDRVSEALLAAVDAHVLKTEDIAASSVPASPVSRPLPNTRRRRSLSALSSDTSEPPPKASKRMTLRAASSDQVTTKHTAVADNLPLSVSELTEAV